MNRAHDMRLPLADRLRIERTLWTLHSHLDDLPFRIKRARRREMRANLYAAAADVGTAEAVHRLGDLTTLAADYLAAEYGDRGPRPSYTMGAVWMISVHVVAGLVTQAGTAAFTAGVLAAEPRATGDFRWPGVPWFIDEATITLRGGEETAAVGGAWAPLVYLISVAALVVGGRLWRLLPWWRRRHAAAGHG
ncbi:hypothetical protein AB0K47_27200 [Streptomyces tirandamycinicus]|uniref:hypothetical protein n=1 Tax=Streptomyces tirandamycinicus TaxID=2174846 RepID=UPI00344AF58A